MSNLTELVFVLDGSGSMFKLVSDTIGGYNSFLNDQKKVEGECIVSTVIFNDTQKVIHDRCDIKSIKDLTDREYVPSGSTALLDAMGRAMHHISTVHRYIRPEDVPNKTMFVIITDGYENASREYSLKHVKSMIEERKNEYNWEFVFLGANMDALEIAESYGIYRDRAATYRNDSHGVRRNYESMSAMVRDFRGSKIKDNWADEINEYRERKEKEGH